MTAKLWISACCLVLGACGGGGSGGGGGGLAGLQLPVAPAAVSDPPAPAPSAEVPANPVADPPAAPNDAPPSGPENPPPVTGVGSDPGPGPGPVPGPRPGTIVTYSYKLGLLGKGLDPFYSRMPFLVQDILNTPDMVGYRYNYAYRPETGNAIFVKSTAVSSYIWVMDDATVPPGDDGRRYLAMAQFFIPASAKLKTLYGKPTPEKTRYDGLEVNINGTNEENLKRLNDAGALGYCRFASGGFGSYLMRANGAADVCNYVFAPNSFATFDDYLAQLNAKGDEGYIPVLKQGGMIFYVKVANSAASYFYYAVEAKSDEAGQLAQLNEEGAKGARSFEVFDERGKPRKLIFRITTNCTRWWLCE